ncbi:TusE/DsrC/DsvC family sulfur relay protein [Inmirania thermothiophila]|uniref:Sulfurtransferase n=1 Tax=Inmirania thermothiophila TaxID=1750597 RepID=A0A3N1Y7W5_9GAMM|nr:TusE/DsrC/DsvC family sulfur relay protein [Inmirania thermothiophila]ROR34598.1 tRNA 2-thiouridine synthesizing protein E [Inmirania thermothiophila]
MEFEIDGRRIETDAEGYLRNLSDWSESLAEALAEREGLKLTEAHWEVIRFLRQGYEETGTVPNVRQLQKSFAKTYGPEKGNSRYLYGLFPYGPAKQACRIAGLPKPTGCV